MLWMQQWVAVRKKNSDAEAVMAVRDGEVKWARQGRDMDKDRDWEM